MFLYMYMCMYMYKGHFLLGGVFRAEQHFLLFKDQLAESGHQKTKENIIPRGKFRLVENHPESHYLQRNKKSPVEYGQSYSFFKRLDIR